MPELTEDDVRQAFTELAQLGRRPRPGLGIPPAHTLSGSVFREVGLLTDVEVAQLAWQGLWAAWGAQPMHPSQACALRVAFARSGAIGEQTVANPTLVEWVTALVRPSGADDE